jgi:ribonuclease J
MKTFNRKNFAEDLTIIPLGGCGNIGKNMTLYIHKSTCIVVDCGTSFPEERIMPGINMIMPNISFILENKIKIDAIVLTHAHEDHIGAVPYLWEHLGKPKVYGTKFALNFLDYKFKDVSKVIEDKYKILISDENNSFKIGSFSIEAAGITHSIPEMVGLKISAGDKSAFHTGDWKFDDTPVIGNATDFTKLHEIGSSGIDVMLCDSTNVFGDGFSKSEGDLEDSLYEICKAQKGMILLTTFASNIARIKTICNVAKKLGKYVGISGLSLVKMTAVAEKSGYDLGYKIYDSKEIMSMPREKCIIICTGCQGEPMASIAKISNHSHSIIKAKKGDTVIFSSKMIPGNEKKITATLNRLVEKGINIVTEQNAFTHVSGHPKKGELKRMYDIIKPKFAVPVHGESIHLKEHVDFVKSECNVENALFVHDGDIIVLKKDSISIVDRFKSDYICIDDILLQEPGGVVMRERRKIKDGGCCVASICIDKKLKINDLNIEYIGLFDRIKQERLDKYLYDTVVKSYKSLIDFDEIKKIDQKSVESIEKRITSTLSKEIYRKIKKEPVIKCIIHKI